MTSTPVRTATLPPSIVTVSPIHRRTQVCFHEQLDASPPQDPAPNSSSDIIKLMTRFLSTPAGVTFRTGIQNRIERKQSRLQLAVSLTWFLRRRKHEIIHLKKVTLKRCKRAQHKKIVKARVERERKRLQIDSGDFNAKAWQNSRRVTTKEKTLQLDQDHFLLSPSQRPLQGERILKREQISDFYFMIDLPLTPRTTSTAVHHA